MQHRFTPYSLLFVSIVLIYGCSNADHSSKQFLDIAGLDSSVKASDDFFEYVNGKWYKSAVIPSTEVGTGSFFDLQIRSEQALKEVCEEAAATSNPVKGSPEQMVGDFYKSIMDTVAIEAKGYSPLQPVFDKIAALKDKNELIHFVAQEAVNGNSILFGFGVGPDDKNASVNIGSFSQGGTSLPERDYYFRHDEQTKKIRSAYITYLTKVFSLTGTDSATAAKNAQTALAVETKIANGQFTNVELRDPQKNYNKFSVDQLKNIAPAVDWVALFGDMMITADSVLMGQPKFFASLNGLLSSVPLEDWKTYLKASTITNSARSLTKKIADASFDFFNKTLSGQQQQKPRWQYAVNVVDGRIGDLSAQLYVKKNFDAHAKKKMMEMIDNLQAAYEKRIKALDWMSDSTKQQAVAKLNAIVRKIGFPDKWKTYDTLVITKDYFQNRINTSRYEYIRNVAKNGKPVDKTEWAFTPPTVNAFYGPTTNEIIFLAGILQPPFFYPDADDAINYGGIGMVIGHELTHGFDDQGRQYDKAGNLKDWWTKADADKFNAKAKLVGAQYDNYIVIDSMRINPDLTMGENLADIGGIAIAYDAFKMTAQSKGNEKIDGLTPDQRFFLSLASIWRLKMKDELTKQIVLTDVHSPAKFRVIGPLVNFTPFYEAFGVKKGDKMWKDEKDRIKIW